MQETQLTTISSAVIDGESHTLDRGAIIYSHRGIASVRINFDHWDMQGESVLIMFPGDVIKWAQGGLSVAGRCRCLTKDSNTSIEKEGYIPYSLQA